MRMMTITNGSFSSKGMGTMLVMAFTALLFLSMPTAGALSTSGPINAIKHEAAVAVSRADGNMGNPVEPLGSWTSAAASQECTYEYSWCDGDRHCSSCSISLAGNHSCALEDETSTLQDEANCDQVEAWICCIVPKGCKNNRNFTDYIECVFEVACPDMVYDCPSGAIRITTGAASKAGYALGALGILVAAAAGHML